MSLSFICLSCLCHIEFTLTFNELFIIRLTPRCLWGVTDCVKWFITECIKIITFIFTAGLCFLPPCFPRLYILVENPKNWSEAQNYCKWKYTDLASVHNEQDLAQLNELLEGKLNTWIGLQADAEAWKWSLQKPGFYGEGEAGFRMWNADEPNGGPAYYKLCAAMYYSSGWVDAICSWSLKFICYNGKNSHTSSCVRV